MITRRAAGAALLVYTLATFAANVLIAAPGGDYEPATVSQFVASGHRASAFAAAYLGVLGAVAFLPFVLGMRAELARLGELAWGLGVAAATAGVSAGSSPAGLPSPWPRAGPRHDGRPERRPCTRSPRSATC